MNMKQIFNESRIPASCYYAVCYSTDRDQIYVLHGQTCILSHSLGHYTHSGGNFDHSPIGRRDLCVNRNSNGLSEAQEEV